MARMGKRERLAKRGLFKAWTDHKQAVVAANLNELDRGTVETSKGYGGRQGKVTPSFEGRMTHGLYRGLYDHEYSTVRDTKRGLK